MKQKKSVAFNNTQIGELLLTAAQRKAPPQFDPATASVIFKTTNGKGLTGARVVFESAAKPRKAK